MKHEFTSEELARFLAWNFDNRICVLRDEDGGCVVSSCGNVWFRGPAEECGDFVWCAWKADPSERGQ